MKKNLFTLVIFSFLTCFFSCKEDDSIKIGVILPLTGAASEIGNNILDGIIISSEYYDSISSKKFSLIIEDSKLDAKQAISAANKLITVDKVKAIIGLASSTEALAVAPICEKNKIPMISSTASTPLLSTAGDYVFRIYPSDVYDGKILANFANEIKKLKTVSILYLNNDFGVGLKNNFITNYINGGGKVEQVETFLPNDIDFKTQLTKIKNKNSDALLVIAIDMQYLNIIKQIRELNIKSQILAPVTFDNPILVEKLGNAADNIVYSRPKYTTDQKTSQEKIFKEKYFELRNSAPPLLTALGYDTYYILCEATRKVDFNQQMIKEQLYKTNCDGVSGKIKFDENGDIIPEIELMIIKDTKSTVYE